MITVTAAGDLHGDVAHEQVAKHRFFVLLLMTSRS